MDFLQAIDAAEKKAEESKPEPVPQPKESSSTGDVPAAVPKPAFKPAFMPTALRVRRQQGAIKKPARRVSPSPLSKAQLAEAAAVKEPELSEEERKALEIKRAEEQRLEAEAKRKRVEEAAKKKYTDDLVQKTMEEAYRGFAKPAPTSASEAAAPPPSTSWYTCPCRRIDELYDRVKTIGRGRSGVVHLAKAKADGALVALKRLHCNTDNKGAKSTVEGVPLEALREVITLAAVQHENVVGIKEILVDGDDTSQSWFASMEYVEYELGMLVEFCKNPFNEGQVKGLVRQLLAALAGLHTAWIVHRDLKMPNLLVSKDGVLKVCDFGLSRLRGDAPGATYTPGVVSMWYRAPELLIGTETYGSEVDIWAAGCLLVELCTRQPLFPGKSEVDQLKLIFSMLGVPKDDADADLISLMEAKGVKPPAEPTPEERKFLRQVVPENGYDPRDVHGASRFNTTALSDTGFQLLSKMLCLSPGKRITALEALEHPWFKEKPVPELLPSDLLARLASEHQEGAKAQATLDAAKKSAAKQSEALLAAQRMAAMLSSQSYAHMAFPTIPRFI